MSTLSLRLPDSLHARLRALAAEDGISINQLVTIAAAEKVAAILAIDYLENRAADADLRAFGRLLDRVPDRPADSGDELPARRPKRVSTTQLREPRPRYAAKRTGAKRPKKR